VNIENSMAGLKITDDMYLSVPEFKKLSDRHGIKAMIFLVCIVDYWSPYRNLLLKDRVLIAGKDIYGTTGNYKKFLDEATYKSAERKYQQLQYDPILDSYAVMSKKIKDINFVIDTKEVELENIKTIQDILKGNEKINDMVIRLKDHIDAISRKSPFRGFSNIEDYHSIENDSL
jgi:hypothetical protein